jgi:pyruvate-ferredoxin/flavodoxin oxidoreductase
LIRYNPALRAAGKKPFVLDSPRPTIPLREYAYNENRYKVLTKSNPEEAERLMVMAQETVDRRWETYEHLSKQEPTQFERAG